METLLETQGKLLQKIDDKLVGKNSNPGFCVRLDRLEQWLGFLKKCIVWLVTPLWIGAATALIIAYCSANAQ